MAGTVSAAPWPRSTAYFSSRCSPPASAAVGGPAWVGPPPTTAGEVLRGARLLRCFAPRDPALSSTALTALQLADRCASKFEERLTTGSSSRRDLRLGPTHVRRSLQTAGRDKLSAGLASVLQTARFFKRGFSQNPLLRTVRSSFLCPYSQFHSRWCSHRKLQREAQKGSVASAREPQRAHDS